MVNRSTPPPDVPMRPSELPLPEETVLPDGVRLLTLPDNRAPVVEFRLILPYAGRAYDAPDWIGLSGAAARLLTAGTPTRNSFEIADEADRYGGYISASANTETAIVSARCLAQHFEPMTRLIADVLLNPTFPPDEVEIDRYNYTDRLRGGLPTQWTLKVRGMAGVARPAEIILVFEAFGMWHGQTTSPSGGAVAEGWNVAFVDGHAKYLQNAIFMDQHPQSPVGGGGRTVRLNQDPEAENPNL